MTAANDPPANGKRRSKKKMGRRKKARKQRQKQADLDVESLESRIMLSATWIDADGDFNSDASTGDDQFLGSNAADVAEALEGNDTLFGNGGDDHLLGGGGDDRLVGGEGDDHLEGGLGSDTADFSDSTSSVEVDITDDSAQTVGSLGSDTLESIEGAIGSDHADRFSFSEATAGETYTIDGGAGTDTIDLTGYSFDDATFSEGSVTISAGPAESFQIDFVDVETFEFSDTSATILDGDSSSEDFSGKAILIDGDDVFQLELKGGGAIDWSYDDSSQQISITDGDGFDNRSEIKLESVSGGDVSVADIDLSGDVKKITSDLDIDRISVDGKVDKAIAVTGNVGSIDIGGELKGRDGINVTGDVGSISIGESSKEDITIGGDLGRFDSPQDYRGDLSVSAVDGPFTVTDGDISFTYTFDSPEEITYQGDHGKLTAASGNLPPAADAGSDSVVSEGAAITLDGELSFDPENGPISYWWAQVSGPAVTLDDATAGKPSFTAPEGISNSDVVFELTVSDGSASSTDTVTITINADNDAPTALAGDDQSVTEGAAVVLDASSSSDPEGSSLTYSWNQTSGPVVSLTGGDGATPTFDAPDLVANTDLRFEVTVSDGVNTSVDSVTITVNADNDAPTASAGIDQVVTEQSEVTLDARGSSDPEGQDLSYQWTQLSGPSVSLSSDSAAAPTFDTPDLTADAVYTFQVEVSDGTHTSIDTVQVTAQPDVLSGGSGADTLTGDGSDNNLEGNGGADDLSGGAGDDLIFGGAGDDTLDGGSGDDLLDGGSGSDTADYSSAGGAVTVDLNESGSQDTGAGGSDTLVDIENVTGSSSSDTLTGDGNDNVLVGGRGHDTLDGGGGDDTLSGGDHNDTLTGGAGDDTLDGGSGNDTLSGGEGDDTIIGGSGTDTVSYADATDGVTVDLSDTGAQDTGGAGTDTISGVERITGSDHDDDLTGNSSNNVLYGGEGSDTLSGELATITCTARMATTRWSVVRATIIYTAARGATPSTSPMRTPT